MCYNVRVSNVGRILGVDFGTKRVGLAVCDDNRTVATPLPVFYTRSMRMTIDHVAELCGRYGVNCVVVGLPLNLDGTDSVQTGRVRAFARNVERVAKLPVELYDERLSTVEADELLIEAGVRRAADRAKLVDSMSAKVILQGYLDNKNK